MVLADQNAWLLRMRREKISIGLIRLIFKVSCANTNAEVQKEALCHHQEDEEGRLHRLEVGVDTYTFTHIRVLTRIHTHTHTHTITSNCLVR